jgi:hypothetical protein
MATTTTNYGFDIPQSTDLVKDGATAIATLGQDIDTAMNTALGTKKAGMVLLNTTSFSGVSSQSVNDVFSATYNSYLINTNITTSNTDADTVFMRLRVGGADNTSSNYRYGQLYVGAYNSVAFGNNNSTTTTGFQIGGTSSTTGSLISTTIFNPFGTNYTTETSSSSGAYILFNAGSMTVNTSYTGFTIYLSGTMTGTVSVYGYNK